MAGFNSTGAIQVGIAKGTFRPHTMLTNMAMSFFQSDAGKAKELFPICPVQLSSDNYYVFSKEDLLRDSWQRKPAYGKVDPAIVGENAKTYNCLVDQMIMGIDQIKRTDDIRRQGPNGLKDPRIMKTKTIAQQANIHQDRLFANAYFKAGVWTNEWAGVASSATGNQFIKFSDDNSEPIKFFDARKTAMKETTGRTPNKLGLGINVFNALKEHPAILERIKYGGTTANPAAVTENVLAQLFGVEKIVVFGSIWNNAQLGQNENMEFICDPDSFLLTYTPSAPSIEEPSAGYIFTWDMLGDGNYMPILQHDGEWGTHSEFIEGLMAQDMKKTCDDLAVFGKSAV